MDYVIPWESPGFSAGCGGPTAFDPFLELFQWEFPPGNDPRAGCGPALHPPAPGGFGCVLERFPAWRFPIQELGTGFLGCRGPFWGLRRLLPTSNPALFLGYSAPWERSRGPSGAGMNPAGSRGAWTRPDKDHIPANWLLVTATGTGNKSSPSDATPSPFRRVWIRYPAFFQAFDQWPSSAARELFTERLDQLSQPRRSQPSPSSPPPPADLEDGPELQRCLGLTGIPILYIPGVPGGMFPTLSLLSLPPLPTHFWTRRTGWNYSPRDFFSHLFPAFPEGCSQPSPSSLPPPLNCFGG